MKTNSGRRSVGALSALFVLAGMIAGCGDSGKSAKRAAEQQPEAAVTVTPVVSKAVSASREFVGQTEAFQTVDLRARVTGFLHERPFKEGGRVEKDALLYVIDPAEFNARRDAAAAKVQRVEATIEEAKLQLERYKVLEARGTASTAKLDQARAAEGEARADLAAAKAELETAKLDVAWTRIASPIGGRIGRSSVDVGNLIGPDSGVLVTVVAEDPIRVTFSISERDYLDYAQAKKDGTARRYTPRIRLANGQLYKHDGKVDFVDNRVDPQTGTIKARIEFPNPEGLILPGLFVNVILVSTVPEDQLVVPQAAVQENQVGPFVLLVDSENRVQTRPVKIGRRTGTEVVVTEGLEAGETIIVEGIQKVRPGAKVNPVQARTAAATGPKSKAEAGDKPNEQKRKSENGAPAEPK